MTKKPVAADRAKFLAKMREQLLEMKAKLLAEIDSELRAEREGNKDEGMDTYDLASEERDREINFILSDRERVKRARRASLMATQSEISLAKNRGLVGREIEVLVEGPMPGRSTRLRGRTAGQAPEIDGSVFLAGEAEAGEFVRARIDKALSYDLHATVAGAAA